MKKYFLSVLSIFKNESHILEEWLNHYINEGVDHFYLLNNNSDDNYTKYFFREEIGPLSFFEVITVNSSL